MQVTQWKKAQKTPQWWKNTARAPPRRGRRKAREGGEYIIHRINKNNTDHSIIYTGTIEAILNHLIKKTSQQINKMYWSEY